jgi:hypothetical protein
MTSSRIVAGLLALGLPAALPAQASPYIPLDDPRLPLIEHLIARGELSDPSPFVRPFRRADVRHALAGADTAGRDGEVLRRLKTEFEDPAEEARWRVEARAGLQGYSHPRRDLLHPAGDAGARPYAELALEAELGPIALVSRPAVEPRLVLDPDWPGRKNLDVTGRHVEGYLSGQFKWVNIFYGQMDRNWGPVGVDGIGLSAAGYPRPAFGAEFMAGGFRLSAVASQLRDEQDTLGQVIHRFFFAHRLDLRLSHRVQLGLWETTVLAGPDRSFDARYRNPVTLLLLANEYGLGDEGNVLVGLDLRWRVRGHTTLEAQLGLDDLQYDNRSGPNRYPDRYAFTLSAYGPLGRRAAWRALYTQASSLAFRSENGFENFIDAGVGLGRNFDDDDQLSGFVTLPVRSRWLLTPELTIFRQGQGLITDAAPIRGPASAATPTLFIGTVATTYRAALGVSGRRGPLRVSAIAGFHHVVNDGNVSGRRADRFEGRITMTIGTGKSGVFH